MNAKRVLCTAAIAIFVVSSVAAVQSNGPSGHKSLVGAWKVKVMPGWMPDNVDQRAGRNLRP